MGGSSCTLLRSEKWDSAIGSDRRDPTALRLSVQTVNTSGFTSILWHEWRRLFTWCVGNSFWTSALNLDLYSEGHSCCGEKIPSFKTTNYVTWWLPVIPESRIYVQGTAICGVQQVATSRGVYHGFIHIKYIAWRQFWPNNACLSIQLFQSMKKAWQPQSHQVSIAGNKGRRGRRVIIAIFEAWMQNEGLHASDSALRLTLLVVSALNHYRIWMMWMVCRDYLLYQTGDSASRVLDYKSNQGAFSFLQL